MKRIKMMYPKPFGEVRAKFIISGWVPNSWLNDGHRVDDRVYIDFIDIEGITFMGSSANIVEKTRWLSRLINRSKFFAVIHFDNINAPFIAQSQGRIVLKISGQKEGEALYVPIIVKGFTPEFNPTVEFIEKHKKVPELVKKYEEEWKDYAKEFEEIITRRQKKSELTEYDNTTITHINQPKLEWELFEILSEDATNKENYFAEEDLELRQLEEKYKNTIRINGPFFGKSVLTYNGFYFVVHSNDHGKHLHLIHKGRGLDVRISFPEVKILSFKKGKLNSKETGKILELIREPDNFKKFEAEFMRRDVPLV